MGSRSFNSWTTLIATLLLISSLLTFGDRHLLWLTNHARYQLGRPILTGDLVLYHEAQHRAAYIAKTGIVSHTIPHVGHAWDELPSSYHWQAAGEILAAFPSFAGDDASAVQAWLHSPDHRRVLLGHWTGAGAAVAMRGGRDYLVVIFIR